MGNNFNMLDTPSTLSPVTGFISFDMTSASGTNPSVTGVGFSPSLIKVFAADVNSNALCVGSFNGTTYMQLAQTAGSAYIASKSSSRILWINQAGGTQVMTATLDNDGFTLVNVKSASPTGTTLIFYECYP